MLKKIKKISTPYTDDDVKLINKILFDKTIYQNVVNCSLHISKSTRPGNILR